MKKIRSAFSCLCLMLLLMNSFTVSAEELVRERQPVELNTTEGLDVYIHWNDDGKTIYLDEGAAKNVGYTDSVIQYVEGNLDRMNRLVAEGYEIEDGYSITVYPENNSKQLLKARRANNVKGITTIKYDWNITYIYMNSVDTFIFMMNFNRIVKAELSILNLFDNVNSIIANSTPAGICINICGFAVQWNYQLACKAASSGNGIVIHQVYYENDGTTHQMFYSQ